MAFTKQTSEFAGYLDPRISRVLWLLGIIAVLAIAVPAVYLVLWSVWGTDVVGRLETPNNGSLKWFRAVLGNYDWQASISASALLAAAASFTGTAINACYSYAKRFAGLRVQTWTAAAMAVVLLNPLIAYGMAMRSAGSLFAISPWLLLYIGHVVVLLPLQFLVFEAAEEVVWTETLWAART